MEISVGDVVQLKSGGPKMTVEVCDKYGPATCAWFDSAGKHNKQDFVAVTLCKV
jgi:uncharacterized protein YodC (DUF2158 family)